MNLERIPLTDLVAWTGGDRVVRAESTPLPGDALCLRDGDAWAVAFARPTYTHGTNVMLHGDDSSGELVSPAVVAALEELVSSAPFAGWLADLRTKGVTAVSLPAPRRTSAASWRSPAACGSGCGRRRPRSTFRGT